MSLMPSREERQKNQVDQWRRQGLYPEGCKNWEAFIDFCNKNTDKPFVMTLESIGGRPEAVTKEYIFGIMNVKGSRFGFDSFSLSFQAKQYRGYYFFQDGLSENVLDLQRSLFGRKISEVSFEPKKINTTLCVYGMMMALVRELEGRWDKLSPESMYHYAKMYQDMNLHLFSHLPQDGFGDSHRTLGQLRKELETVLEKRISETKAALVVAKEANEKYTAAAKLLE